MGRAARGTIATALATALALLCSEGAAARKSETDDVDQRAETAARRASLIAPTHLTEDEVRFLEEYGDYQATQKVGFGFFGSGFGLCLVGIALTLIDPWGALGLAGFITVGGGVVTMSSGMFVLALSRSAWQEKLREDFDGVLTWRTVGYSWYF